MEHATLQWLDTARGPYAVIAQADGALTDGAETVLCKSVQESAAPLLYADAEVRSNTGRHALYKPDYAPDTLLSHNYVGSPLLLSRAFLEQMGGAMDAMDADMLYSLTVRCMLRAEKALHIPRVLFRGGPPPLPKTTAAVREGVALLGRSGVAAEAAEAGCFTVRYGLRRPEKISVIVRGWGDMEALRRTLESVELRSSYENYELIVVDGGIIPERTARYYDRLERGRAAKIVRCPGKDNDAQLKNTAASRAEGAFLLFLEAGVELGGHDALLRLAEHAQHPETGAVGGLVEDAQGNLLHAGLFVDANSVPCPQRRPGKAGERQSSDDARCTHNVTLLGGGAFLLRSDDFFSAGGFDETFDSCWCEAALALLLSRRKRFNVFTPDARFVRTAARIAPLSRRNRERCGDVFGPLRRLGDPLRSQNPAFLAESRAGTGRSGGAK